ncbi:MAG: mechanosensitive ion channel family protein [Ignavibacteria bacterium]|nr:mechanosensitive ion channel family protein [Ignavibacteria bacterium]
MLQYILNENILKSDFLQNKFLGNRVVEYLDFLVIFLFFVLLIKLFRATVLVLLHKFAKKAQSKVFDFILGKIKKLLIPIEYFGVFYFAFKTLKLSNYVSKGLDVVALLIVVYYVTRFVVALVDFLIEQKIEKSAAPSKASVLRAIIPAINIALWALGIVFILSNLGFNISALVAGLGIGGLAIALAGQKILGDLFSYVSILIDKPFEIGDSILIDGNWGTVEYIGIRSTRLRSLTGELHVFANSDITAARIRNYTKMKERRAEINFGVVYETPLEKLREIPQIIQSVIDGIEKVRFDRVHFRAFGAFSLDFQAIFWVEDDNLKVFLDKQQEILYKIFDEFKKHQINFAYPTSKVFLENINNNDIN